jgi:cell division protein FtsL
VLGVLAALNSLSRNPSLDRLIRGRTWIALIAFALIGIVTLQLLVLRLNANIGHALVREAQLQRENAALSIESSELAAGERVESLAARLGMELVPEGALRFLTIDPRRDIARAAAALSKPVQAPSSDSAETAGESTTSQASEASAATSTSAEASAASSGSASAGSTTNEASATPSESSAATVGESPSASSSATQPASAEAPATAAAGATGATEAAQGGANGTQSGGTG